MKLISLLAMSVQANANKASQREQMKFNFQTSKNALFKFSETEDVEMIKSKRGLFGTVFWDKLGEYHVPLFGNETRWVEPRQVSWLCQLARGHFVSEKRLSKTWIQNVNLELRIFRRRPCNLRQLSWSDSSLLRFNYEQAEICQSSPRAWGRLLHSQRLYYFSSVRSMSAKKRRSCQSFQRFWNWSPSLAISCEKWNESISGGVHRRICWVAAAFHRP